MALTFPGNQALNILPNGATQAGCDCGNNNFCLPLTFDDSLYLQGTATVNGSPNRVYNGEITGSATGWTLDTGWAYSSNTIAGSNPANGTAINTNLTLNLFIDFIYRVDVSVTVTSASGLGDADGLAVYVSGQEVASAIKTTTVVSSYILFDGTGGNDVIIALTKGAGSINFNINFVRVLPVSRLGYRTVGAFSYFGAYTPHVRTVFNTQTSYNTIAPLNYFWEIDFGSDFSKERDTGCICVRLFDGWWYNNQIRNGAFADSSYWWQVPDDWNLSGGNAQYTSPGGTYTASALKQSVYLLGGLTYTISIDIGSLNFNHSVKVYVENISPPSTIIIGTSNLGGTRTFTFTPNTTGNYVFGFIEGENGANFTLDNILIYASPSNNVNYYNYEACCINLQEEHDCTVTLTATNNDNAFGFEYYGGFQHQMRIPGKFEYFAYKEEAETHNFADNSRELLYASRTKQYKLQLTNCPEWVHDCVNLIRLHDTLTINGTEYIRDSDYELSRRKTSLLAFGSFLVTEKEGVGNNYNCG